PTRIKTHRIPRHLDLVDSRHRTKVDAAPRVDDRVVRDCDIAGRGIRCVDPDTVFEPANQVPIDQNILSNHSDVEAARATTQRRTLSHDGVAGDDGLSPAYLHAHRFAAKRVPGDGHILAAPVRVNRGLPGTVRSTASDG